MIFLSENEFDIDKYIDQFFKNHRNYNSISQYIDKIFNICLRIGKENRNDNELIPTTQLGFLNSILSFLKKDKDTIHSDKQMFIHAILQSFSNNFINMSNILSKIYKSLDSIIEERNQEDILKKYVVNDKWIE